MLEEQLIKRLRARQDQIASDLLAGTPPDYEAYRQAVGHAAGLQEALQIIENHLKGKEDL